MNNLVESIDFSYRYNEAPNAALRNISFEVQSGDFVAMVLENQLCVMHYQD